MTDHPYQPGTTWAPKSGRGEPRTIVEAYLPQWSELRDTRGRPYIWWDALVDGRLELCGGVTVEQFERWAGEQVG